MQLFNTDFNCANKSGVKDTNTFNCKLELYEAHTTSISIEHTSQCIWCDRIKDINAHFVQICVTPFMLQHIFVSGSPSHTFEIVLKRKYLFYLIENCCKTNFGTHTSIKTQRSARPLKNLSKHYVAHKDNRLHFFSEKLFHP